MAIRLAHTLVVSNVLDFIELSRDISIVEMPTPPTFVGRTLRELELRPRFGLTLIAIKRSTQDGGQITMVAPTADDRVQEGDVLSLLGPNDRLGGLESLLAKS